MSVLPVFARYEKYRSQTIKIHIFINPERFYIFRYHGYIIPSQKQILSKVLGKYDKANHCTNDLRCVILKWAVLVAFSRVSKFSVSVRNILLIKSALSNGFEQSTDTTLWYYILYHWSWFMTILFNLNINWWWLLCWWEI